MGRQRYVLNESVVRAVDWAVIERGIVKSVKSVSPPNDPLFLRVRQKLSGTRKGLLLPPLI